MTQYLTGEPMHFQMPGRNVTDLQWDIATGRRCHRCHALKADGHVCGVTVERTSAQGGVIHTPRGLDVPWTLAEVVDGQ